MAGSITFLHFCFPGLWVELHQGLYFVVRINIYFSRGAGVSIFVSSSFFIFALFFG